MSRIISVPLIICLLFIAGTSLAESAGKPVICGVHEKYLGEWAEILNIDKLNSKGIPWRITNDQPPLVEVSAQLYAVRNGSAFEDIAPQLFERIIVHRDDLYYGHPWTMVYDPINPSRVNVEEMNRLFLKENGQKYSWQWYTQEYVDSAYDIHKYAVPAYDSDDIEGQGTWTTKKHSYEDFMSVQKKFLNGKMTAAEFAAKWDQMTGAAE